MPSYYAKFQFLSVLMLLLFLTNSTSIQAQTDDNIIWATLKASKALNDKTSIFVAPIFRFNENIGNYQNTSIDYAIKQKIAKNWHVQLIGRTWFVPENIIRQFLWVDIGYGQKFENVRFASHVRLHYAFDVDDRPDGDFIRWKSTFGLTHLGKFKPFIAIEPWWQLSKINDLRRIRFEPGFTYSLNKALDLTLVWRREESLNLDPGFKFNQYVITLAYKILKKQTN